MMGPDSTSPVEYFRLTDLIIAVPHGIKSIGNVRPATCIPLLITQGHKEFLNNGQQIVGNSSMVDSK